MRRLSKKLAEELAVKVCGTKKGLVDTSEGKIVHSYQLIIGEMRIDIAEELPKYMVPSNLIRVDVTFNDHHAPAWYKINSLEPDYDADEK